jgi:hypothetical protein
MVTQARLPLKPEPFSSDLLRTEMNADGQLAIHGLITIHLWQKRPLIEGQQGYLRQLTMRSRLKNDDGRISVFTDEKPGLEPII